MTSCINEYSYNFVEFNFAQDFIIVEKDLTQCFGNANFKRHYLLAITLCFKILQNKEQLLLLIPASESLLVITEKFVLQSSWHDI